MSSPSRHDIWVFGYGSLMWRPGFAYVERSPATVTGYHRALCIASTLHRGTCARPGLVLGLDRGGACSGMAYRIAADDVPGVIAYLRERELVYGVYRETWVTAELTTSMGASDAHPRTDCHPGPCARDPSGRALGGQTRAQAMPQSPNPAHRASREIGPGDMPRDNTESEGGSSHLAQHPRVVTALAYTVERCHPSYTGRLPLATQAAIVRGARGQSGANLDYLINTVRHLEELGMRERSLERLMGVAAGYAANTNGSSDAQVRPSVRSLCATWARRPAPQVRVPVGDQRRFGHRIAVPGA